MSEPRELVTLGELAELNPESLGAKTPTDHIFKYIDLTSVSHGSIDTAALEQFRFVNAPSRARRVVRDGDVLFGTVRPRLRSHARVAGHGYVASTGFCVTRARPSVADGGFLGHFLLSEEATRQAIRREVGSNYPAVTERDVAAFRLPCIPLAEQRRIAEILDTINDTIQATERVIAKLELTRLGVRERFCASKGFGGRITRLSELVEAVVDCPHSTPNYRRFGVLVARTMHIKNGRFLDSNASRVSENVYRQRVARMVPSAGDVVLTREAPVGEVFAIPQGMRICLGQRVVLIRPGRHLLGQYLVELIYSSQGHRQINRLVAGTTNPHLNVGEIRDLAFDIPPVDKQRRAVRSLDAVNTRIEAETAQLEKLRWTRSGLAADLLSGRVRTGAS